MQISLLTAVTMILVLVSASAESHIRGLQAKKCSDSGSDAQHGGDCSNTPTYCGSSGNAVSCSYQEPRPFDKITNVCKDTCRAEFRGKNNDSTGGVPGSGRYTCNEEEMNNHPNWCTYRSCRWDCPDDIVTPSRLPEQYADEARNCLIKRCSPEVTEDFPDWCRSDYMERFGGYRGGCSGTKNCLNLDFHCAEGENCEMSCTGTNSCNGLTMHCADNQSCMLRCHASNGNPMCVGAKVICGEGTVSKFNGSACEPVDPNEDCNKGINKLFTRAPIKQSPTKAPRPSKVCVDAGPDIDVFKGNNCDWITKNKKNIARKCNKKPSKSKFSNVYDLCPVTCAKVGLGPCANEIKNPFLN